MARRRVVKKTFECMHRGFGKQCRRCDAALRFKHLSETGAKYVTNKKQDEKRHKAWTAKQLLDECDRLLEVPRRKEYLDG